MSMRSRLPSAGNWRGALFIFFKLLSSFDIVVFEKRTCRGQVISMYDRGAGSLEGPGKRGVLFTHRQRRGVGGDRRTLLAMRGSKMRSTLVKVMAVPAVCLTLWGTAGVAQADTEPA